MAQFLQKPGASLRWRACAASWRCRRVQKNRPVCPARPAPGRRARWEQRDFSPAPAPRPAPCGARPVPRPAHRRSAVRPGGMRSANVQTHCRNGATAPMSSTTRLKSYGRPASRSATACMACATAGGDRSAFGNRPVVLRRRAWVAAASACGSCTAGMPRGPPARAQEPGTVSNSHQPVVSEAMPASLHAFFWCLPRHTRHAPQGQCIPMLKNPKVEKDHRCGSVGRGAPGEQTLLTPFTPRAREDRTAVAGRIPVLAMPLLLAFLPHPFFALQRL